MPCLKQPDAGLSALLYQRQRKSLLNQQAFEDLLGWLMGLEPTTTGITILFTVHLYIYRIVDLSIKTSTYKKSEK